jgi:hypothetical protein
VEVGERRRWERVEGERGHDAEVACPGSAQRPEQILKLVHAAVDDGAVGEDNLRADQAVERQPVRTPEDADSAAQRQPRDTHRRTGAGRDRKAVRDQPLRELSCARAGADADDAIGKGNEVQRRHVDDDSRRRRVAGQRVTAASRRNRDAPAAGEGDYFANVVRVGAVGERLRSDLIEARDERLSRPLVLLCSGQHKLA